MALAARVSWLSWLVWLGLLPLLWALQGRNPPFWLGLGSFVGGVVCNLAALDWMRTSDGGDGLSGPHVLEWFVLSELCAVTWPLVALSGQWLWRHRGLKPALAFPLLWVGADWLRVTSSQLHSYGTPFPWLHLAEWPGVGLLASQFADIGGVYAVTLAVVAVNAGFFACLITLLSFDSPPSGWRPKTMRLIRQGWWYGLVAGVALIYGYHRLSYVAKSTGPTAWAMPVWTSGHYLLGSHDADGTRGPSHGKPTRGDIAATSSSGSEPTDILPIMVWPEGAYSSSLVSDTLIAHVSEKHRPENASREKGISIQQIRDTNTHNLEQLTHCSKALNSVMVVGCFRQDFHDGDLRYYNSAAIVHPRRGILGYYDKIALVPGVEGTPRLGSIFGYGEHGTYDPGFGTRVFEASKSTTGPGYRFGVAICYDICFPEIFRRYFAAQEKERRPEFFVVPASEAADQRGLLQRILLRMACLRAIETRRPIVRSVYQGYSALVDGSGRVLNRSEIALLRAPFRLGRVPRDNRQSLYMRWGDWLPPTSISILLAASVLTPLFRRHTSLEHTVGR